MADLHNEFENGSSPKGLKGFFGLAVMLAVSLLAVVNLALVAWSPLAKIDPDNLPAAHTWVWWAAHEYLAQPKAPNVVLLGSSLVMHSVSRQDADFLGKDLDYVKHHRSMYMEKALSDRGLDNLVCYNFALPGGMISDDYMVARALFPTRKPQVVVLGLSIRDFIDNGVHSAGGTPAFRYLKRFTEVDDLVDIAMPQLWQRVDYGCGKLLYLWGKKLEMQVCLAEEVKRVLQPIYQRAFYPSQLAQADPARNQPSNMRAEVEEGMMIVKHAEPYSYADNSAEYKRRYRSPNTKGVVVQDYFFERLLQLTRDQGIKVVMVNMPLTEANHKLMPAGSYERYIATLTSAGKKYGIPFFDLDAGGKFDVSNFYDTSHMNASGGRKLIDIVADTLAGRQELVCALKQRTAAQSVASQGAAH